MDDHKPIFTVFTPTYNRAHTIERVYDSLNAQTFKAFEWLIVDDGSTDGTEKIIRQWQKQAPFPIRYIWQENAHKKTAFIRGVREAKGELFLPADSDDAFPPNALEIFINEWDAIDIEERMHFSGVWGLCVGTDNIIVGDQFKNDVLNTSAAELLYKYKTRGEKWGFTRLEVLKEFPFPENIPGFVTENVIWIPIGKVYKLRCINKVTRVYYQNQEGNITNEGHSLNFIERNAIGLHYGYARSLNEDLSLFFYSPFLFLRYSVHCVRFSLHLRKLSKKPAMSLSNIYAKILFIISAPIGFFLYKRDRRS